MSKKDIGLHEIIFSKKKSLLHQLFYMIFETQSCNRQFTRETVKLFVTEFMIYLHPEILHKDTSEQFNDEFDDK